MDPERRRLLEARRREHQAELELRARREHVRERLEVLDAHGVPHELLYDERPHYDWLWRSFPWTGGLTSPRIHRERVDAGSAGPETDAPDDEVRAWLAEVAARHDLADADVLVLPDHGLAPAIRISAGALLAHPAVVSSGFDAWVACEAEGWAIEFLRFGDGWWWGQAPDTAQGADG